MQIHSPGTDVVVPNFAFTNDVGLPDRYDELAAFNAAHPIVKEDCAVIVGTGGLLSMADVLPPTVYVTDKEPALLSWVAYNVGLIVASDTRGAFMDGISHFSGVGVSLSREMRLLGNLHYMYDDARYQQAREAVGKLAIQFIEMDYSKPGEIKSLAREIQPHRLRVFNATNMHRHIVNQGTLSGGNRVEIVSKYIRSLGVLPWADSYGIMASSARTYSDTQSLSLMPSLDVYFEEVAQEQTMTYDDARTLVRQRRIYRRSL